GVLVRTSHWCISQHALPSSANSPCRRPYTLAPPPDGLLAAAGGTDEGTSEAHRGTRFEPPAWNPCRRYRKLMFPTNRARCRSEVPPATTTIPEPTENAIVPLPLLYTAVPSAR